MGRSSQVGNSWRFVRMPFLQYTPHRPMPIATQACDSDRLGRRSMRMLLICIVRMHVDGTMRGRTDAWMCRGDSDLRWRTILWIISSVHV